MRWMHLYWLIQIQVECKEGELPERQQYNPEEERELCRTDMEGMIMWKKIKDGFQEWMTDVKDGYRDIWEKQRKNQKERIKARSLRGAKRLAEQRHKADNRRYYVLQDWRDKYVVFNSAEFKALRRNGVFDKRTKMYDVIRESAYMTKKGTV